MSTTSPPEGLTRLRYLDPYRPGQRAPARNSLGIRRALITRSAAVRHKPPALRLSPDLRDQIKPSRALRERCRDAKHLETDRSRYFPSAALGLAARACKR